MNRRKYILLLIFFTFTFLLFAVDKDVSKASDVATFFDDIAKDLPKSIISKIELNKGEFFIDLKRVLKSEKEDSLILVDKKHLLPASFTPGKVVMLSELKHRTYKLDRYNIELSAIVLDSLQEMGTAAKKDGIILTVSCGYRPYAYQKKLFNNYAKEYGLANAKKFSAEPGMSQHQLGTTIDFGTITDADAKTPAGKWLFKNAYKFGWSLSYPRGMEKITGYNWECWHYRYIGIEASAFEKKWFQGIQQYMLEFIDKWKKSNIRL